MKYYVYNYVDRTKVSDKEFAEKNMFSNNIGNIFFLQGVCNSLNAQIIGETSGGGGEYTSLSLTRRKHVQEQCTK